MNSSLRTQIRNRMTLKETDELLEIWQTNDHFEWSEEAFEVIKEILEERGVEIPEQKEPIYEHKEEENNESYDFSEEELRIIDDENSPAFYDPLDVLVTTKQIDRLTKWVIVFTILYNILNFQRTMGIVQPYFIRTPDSILVYVFTILILAFNAALGIIVIYFPLRALTHILKILMDIEFRSRKAN